MNRTFPKCLKTNVGSGLNQRIVLLPYTGNLTAAKFAELGERLHKYGTAEKLAVGSVEHCTHYLRNEWYVGREKDVKVVTNSVGNLDLSGPGWMSCNFPHGSVAILE